MQLILIIHRVELFTGADLRGDEGDILFSPPPNVSKKGVKNEIWIAKLEEEKKRKQETKVFLHYPPPKKKNG